MLPIYLKCKEWNRLCRQRWNGRHFEVLDSSSNNMVGDVNADGKVNATDRRILARYLAKWSGAEEQILSWDAADINKDGKINASDRRILARYLAKWGGEYDKYFE